MLCQTQRCLPLWRTSQWPHTHTQLHTTPSLLAALLFMLIVTAKCKHCFVPQTQYFFVCFLISRRFYCCRALSLYFRFAFCLLLFLLFFFHLAFKILLKARWKCVWCWVFSGYPVCSCGCCCCCCCWRLSARSVDFISVCILLNRIPFAPLHAAHLPKCLTFEVFCATNVLAPICIYVGGNPQINMRRVFTVECRLRKIFQFNSAFFLHNFIFIFICQSLLCVAFFRFGCALGWFDNSAEALAADFLMLSSAALLRFTLLCCSWVIKLCTVILVLLPHSNWS